MDADAGDTIEIHKPKPDLRVGEFMREMAAVILGILIALVLQQTVEAQHWAQMVKEGRAELREELAVQAHSWAYRVRNHPCSVQRLKDVDTLLDKLDAGQRVPRISPFEAPYGANTPQAVWRSLAASGVVSHLDSKELLVLSQFYSTDDDVAAWNIANDNDWSTISLIVGDPNRLPASDRNQIRVAVKRELLLEKVWDMVGRDQLERARKLGVSDARDAPSGYAGVSPECRPFQIG